MQHSFHGNLSSETKTLTVYIEGDGHAWKNKWTPSTDPTPWNPISLRLAVQDPQPKVIYLARPCQFNSPLDKKNCHSKYWTNHRYSKEVVSSFNDALNQAKTLSNTEQLELIGYSGGGVLAALLSAQRKDVKKFITIAANLDLTAWVKKHGISNLSGSLNPIDYASQLKSIPQIHFIGKEDKIVPPGILQSYLYKLGNTNSVQSIIMPNYNHECCWIESWKQLYAEHLSIKPVN